MSQIKNVCSRAFSGDIPYRCGIVALIVGTVLNLINQGDAMLGASPLNWAKLVLTYLVPYFVCTYGAISSLPSDGNRMDDPS